MVYKQVKVKKHTLVGMNVIWRQQQHLLLHQVLAPLIFRQNCKPEGGNIQQTHVHACITAHNISLRSLGPNKRKVKGENVTEKGIQRKIIKTDVVTLF